MTTDDHRIEKAAWLRAAVLGANDGVVSTASLVLGVAAANASTETVLTAGLAGLFAGAFSMAAGEYVSVSSERDLEIAELAREKRHLRENPAGELRELIENLADRGLDQELAKTVATAMTEHDALAAHAHEEFGIMGAPSAKPVLAAVASAIAFAIGATFPLVAMVTASANMRQPLTLAVSLGALVLLALWSSRLGGSPFGRTALRVVAGGALAMAATSLVGHLFGAAI